MTAPKTMAFSAATLLLACGAQAATVPGAYTIDFEGFDHGEIVSGMTLEGGAGLTVDNLNTTTDLGVVIDTQVYSPVDSDLTGPSWDGGNLAAGDTVLGNALIIQEVDSNFAGYTDANQTHVNLPDDEGRRPAGSFFFDFESPIDSFGFDLIDIEGIEEYDDFSGYVMTFTGQDTGGTPVTRTVSFGEFVDPGSAFYDPSVEFGNNHANRIAPLTAAGLDLTSFDRVEISLGGSGAVDNVQFNVVPEPGSVVLLGLAGMALIRRRRA